MLSKNNDIIILLEQVNFWDSEVKKTGFYRSTYIEFFEKLLNTKDLIKVIIGQRRVGKSYIIRQLIQNLIEKHNVNPKNILYLNFELDKLSFIKDKNDLNNIVEEYIKKVSKKGKVYLFFDEIQEIEGWEKLVNSYRADLNFDCEIFISGSNSNLLNSELATYLSGRYISKNIYPFSYEEYLGFKKLENSKANFLNYINFSGMPELYNLDDEELRLTFVRGLKDTIILKDIVKRHKIKEIDLLEKVFLFLMDNIGNLFSLNSIVKKLKSIGIHTNTVTLGNYLRFIEQTLAIYGVDRFDLRGKKILEGEKKYYFNDLCFNNYLSSSFEDSIGKKLENYIFNLLNQKGYKIYVGNFLNYGIDFVAENKDKKIYIQVTYLLYNEETIKREFGNLTKIKDNWEKYVISTDDIIFSSSDGIKHLQIWDIGNVF